MYRKHKFDFSIQCIITIKYIFLLKLHVRMTNMEKTVLKTVLVHLRNMRGVTQTERACVDQGGMERIVQKVILLTLSSKLNHNFQYGFTFNIVLTNCKTKSFSDFFLACDEGKYGEECKYSCSCRNNATCDHVTGICNCSSVKGKTGTLCDEGETIVKKT